MCSLSHQMWHQTTWNRNGGRSVNNIPRLVVGWHLDRRGRLEFHLKVASPERAARGVLFLSTCPRNGTILRSRSVRMRRSLNGVAEQGFGRFAHQVVMSNEGSRKEEDENEVDKNMAGTFALLCQWFMDIMGRLGSFKTPKNTIRNFKILFKYVEHTAVTHLKKSRVLSGKLTVPTNLLGQTPFSHKAPC